MARRPLIWLIVGAALLAVGMAVVDSWLDGERFDPADFALEILDRAMTLGAMVAVSWLTISVRALKTEQRALRQDLGRAVARGESWRAQTRPVLEDLSAAIERQFAAWSLTRAEADIAGLMLKGVALRDIARLRQTSETTIRQQAQAVYRKSGLSGRAEFSAYFLESLFERPATGPGGADPGSDNGFFAGRDSC